MSKRYETGFVFLLNILWLRTVENGDNSEFTCIPRATVFGGCLVLSPSLPRSVIKRDGSRARRCVQGLLRTRVQDVNVYPHHKAKRVLFWQNVSSDFAAILYLILC